jgi:hypothetical protein
MLKVLERGSYARSLSMGGNLFGNPGVDTSGCAGGRAL